MSNIVDEKWRARPIPDTLLARAETSSSVRRARIEGWPGPEFFFGGKRTNSNALLLEGSYNRIFNTAVRTPVPWQSRGYPILPDLRNCLFLVHMNNAALNFVLSVSANCGEPFCAHLQCSLDNSLRSIVLFAASLKSFAASLMETWGPADDHDSNWMWRFTDEVRIVA